MIISNENVQILENGSLIIKEVSKDDKGYYMCQATNDVGSGLSTVVHLKVHGRYLTYFHRFRIIDSLLMLRKIFLCEVAEAIARISGI